MKINKLFATPLFVGLLLFALPACERNEDNPAKEAEETNEEKFGSRQMENDAEYMVDAASAGLMEVRLSEEARDHATTKETRDLASRMVTSHQAMNDRLKTLAAQKQITIPTELTTRQSDDISDLNKKSGLRYDQKYVNQLISEHKDAIDLFERASNNATDADIRNFFSTNLPELRNHLDMARAEDDRIDRIDDPAWKQNVKEKIDIKTDRDKTTGY